METIYENQSVINEAIAKFITNLKKTAGERRTSDYFRRRLELLQNYWADYEKNHRDLCKFGIREHPYFIESDYESTRELYQTARDIIDQQQQEIGLGRPAAAAVVAEQPGETRPSEISAPREQPIEAKAGPSRVLVSKGTTSKLDDLLRKQMVNFTAFRRTAGNVRLESMSEKWEFDDILKELQSRWTAIDSLHWDIYMELNGEDEEYEMEFTKHENTFINLKKSINKKMWSVSHREKSVPQMDIPIFSGTYQQWTSFKDLFNEAIHNNPSLSPAQKMQFLKGKLRGEAERLIQHLNISSSNYNVCWEILNNRYNNKKLIFTSHLNTLLNMPNMSNQSATHIKRMHDVILETLHAITNLGVDVTTWDPILIHILSQKLDSDTFNDYIDSLNNSRELPILKDFLSYLENKFISLESSRRKQDLVPKVTQQNNQKFYNYGRKPGVNAYSNNSYPKSYHVGTNKCALCKGEHGVPNCIKFTSMPNEIKLQTANKLNLCINCLFRHNSKQCISTKRCHRCHGKHNTLLHECFTKTNPSANNSLPIAKANEPISNNNIHVSQNGSSEVLLATALLRVKAGDGSDMTLRALIDQGSQISLISENAAQRLGVKRSFCRGVIYGLGEKESNCKGMVSITCSSIYSDFTFSTDALIMANLIKNLPSTSFTKPSWSFIQNINLADKEFWLSRPVDLLLGSDIYALIKMGGICRGDEPSQPLAEQTQLGWILFGKMQSFQCNIVLTNVESIQRFWEVEDLEEEPDLSSDDKACMEFYSATTQRQVNGRYIVRLPMKPETQEKLGRSKNIAIAQLKNLEKKFVKQDGFSSEYKGFMNEYIALQHMVPAKCNITSPGCFLPHHGVQRVDSLSTKLRVVFNASAKTSSGYSLNDMMYKGPNLQRDLQCLIVKWRIYPYAFVSDIEKMYRQILVHEEDQPYQQIVWRELQEQPIQTFQLTTVTYGTKAAPFLAMRTLQQLAADESGKYPEAACILKEAFYMDDLLHGSFDIESGKKLINDMINLLRAGGFQLRKWRTNEQKLLECIEDKNGENQLAFNFKSNVATKTLGLCWDPKNDKFTFKYSIDNKTPTKRAVLSEISKLFDPLGWIAPLTTKLKLVFQSVWLANLQWDDEIPEEINKEWMKIKLDISHLSDCEIPRWIGCMQEDVIELHGFCDASLKAYACVIYARIIRKSEVSVALLAAKTRLVPCNKTISLPRLEICGAHLLSKLIRKILECFKGRGIKVYCWTDSMVVLSWLQGNPGRWKTFVANRVRSITEVIQGEKWRYVRSAENPADAASRGLLASQLASNTLWWRGPEWLKSYKDKQESTSYLTEEELKTNRVNVVQRSQNSIINLLLNSKSSLTKVIRIIAWILRAINSLAFNKCVGINKHNANKQLPSYLTLHELKRAKLLIIKYIQRTEYSEDFHYLLQHNKLHNKSKLLNLGVFLDGSKILRVGGRLNNARICIEMKHPIVIPYNGKFTNLLIQQAHQLTYHGGPRLTQANLRMRYWIVSGNRVVKKVVRNCVKCRKYEPIKQSQLMGNLPEERINPALPFSHTGVDYTGYVEVKTNKGRGVKTTKGYIAVFICMVTKAVHLELVSDLSSSAFLAALRRMVARRGAPNHLYSDNGTNFVGANRMLKEEYHDLKNTLGEEFFHEIAELNIEWHFNAPSWPSAGGLWERAVRSMKHHLKRVVGEQKLTFEEYTTLLAQIEACLNSRPLCSLTENADDLDFLTPAHFLSGRPGTTIIETEHDARTRWHMTSKLATDIWKRFKTEYLTQLSVRSKWHKERENMKIGDMVTIQDENLPPGRWLLGRVIELHPGKDGLVRVVSLRTKNGIIKRPVLKLSVLPIAAASSDRKEKIEDERERSSVRRRNPLKKSSLISMVIYSFILFMTLLSGSQASLKVTALKEDQGLYFDKIGNMKIARDEWKLVIYYNMYPYWEGMATVDKYVKYLNNVCASISKQSHCDVALSQLKHNTAELEFNNLILLGQRNLTRARSKRGIINGVGYLANTLFGVLDEHFAEQYQRDINAIRQNENHMRALWKNQTSVIEGEYNVLKRMEDTISKQHKIVNQNLNILEQGLNSLKKEVQSIEVINEFTMSIIIASNLVINLRNVQDQLLDLITDVHYERYNFHLLSPQQLQREFDIISGQLTKDLSLPVDNISQEMAKLYKILKVKARMTAKYFIFEVSIPLVTRDIFELHKIIAIPRHSGTGMLSIIPISDYLAINLQKDIFIPMEQDDMQRCLYFSSTYQCNLQTTFFHLKPDSKLCLIDSSSYQCQTRLSICEHKWFKLHEPNTFLFSCCKQCVLRLICDDQVTVEQLKGSGIIHLKSDCLIKEKDFTAYSEKEAIRTIAIEPNLYNPQLAPINHLLNISLKIYGNETSSATIHRNLEKLGQQINQLKSVELPQDSSLVYHHVHHYVISYVLLTAGVVVAAVFIWRRCSRRRSVKQLPAAGRYRPSPSPNISVISVGSARNKNKADRQLSEKCTVTVNKDASTSPIPLRVYKVTDVV